LVHAPSQRKRPAGDARNSCPVVSSIARSLHADAGAGASDVTVPVVVSTREARQVAETTYRELSSPSWNKPEAGSTVATSVHVVPSKRASEDVLKATKLVEFDRTLVYFDVGCMRSVNCPSHAMRSRPISIPIAPWLFAAASDITSAAPGRTTFQPNLSQSLIFGWQKLLQVKAP